MPDLKENVNESLHVLFALTIPRYFSTAEILILEARLLQVVAGGVDVHVVQILMHDRIWVDQISTRDCMHICSCVTLAADDKKSKGLPPRPKKISFSALNNLSPLFQDDT